MRRTGVKYFGTELPRRQVADFSTGLVPCICARHTLAELTPKYPTLVATTPG